MSTTGKGKQPAAPSMDAIKSIRDYVSAMIDSVKGVKVLLLDDNTVCWTTDSNKHRKKLFL